jgi:fatty acid-binding protein DegV
MEKVLCPTMYLVTLMGKDHEFCCEVELLQNEHNIFFMPTKVANGGKFYFLKEISEDGEVIYAEDRTKQILPTCIM